MERIRAILLSSHALTVLIMINLVLRWKGLSGVQTWILRPWKEGVGTVPPQECEIKAVKQAINWACSCRFMKSRCLDRALLSYYVLRSIGTSPSFFIGVRRRPFSAHAWVELDGRPFSIYAHSPEDEPPSIILSYPITRDIERS